MAFRRGQLPKLSSYENALAHFNAVTPIKGRPTEVKPLGLRRRDEAVIQKYKDNIECVLYNTEVITFKPDNTIVINTDGHNTQLTASFITCVLAGLGIHARQWDNDLVLGIRGADLKEYRVFNGLTIDNKTLRPTVVNPVADTYHVADRQKMKEVRSRYKAFIDYMKLMNKVTERIDATGIPEISKHRGLSVFMDSVESASKEEDLEQMLYLYKRLVVSRTLRGGYVMNRAGFNTDPKQLVVIPQEVTRTWDELLKYNHGDEIFVEQSAPLGTVKRDDNRKYL